MSASNPAGLQDVVTRAVADLDAIGRSFGSEAEAYAWWMGRKAEDGTMLWDVYWRLKQAAGLVRDPEVMR